jgi:DNA-binding NtrC family response regulator
MKRPPPVRAGSLFADKKHILLVVTHSPKNSLRANVLRKHGMDVVCAHHVGDARLLFHPGAYDLVLFDLRHDNGAAVELSEEMKAESPGQRVAFLVGKPDYLAASPDSTDRSADVPPKRYEETLRQLMATACEALPRRGGFLEATWRMSLARAVKPEAMPQAPPPVVHALTTLEEAPTSFSFGDAVRQAEIDGQLS